MYTRLGWEAVGRIQITVVVVVASITATAASAVDQHLVHGELILKLEHTLIGSAFHVVFPMIRFVVILETFKISEDFLGLEKVTNDTIC